MYQLYGWPGSASMAPELVLEEIGAEYEFIEVSIRPEAERPAAYLKINPHGKVPTLVHDGQVIFENAAICLYLADRHPQSGLVPAVDDPLRGQLYRWLFYLADVLQVTYLEFFFPERHSTEPTDAQAVAAKAVDNVSDIYRVLDAALENGPFFLGERISVCDLFLLMLTNPTWHEDAFRPIAEFENVARLVGLAAERPALQRFLKFNAVWGDPASGTVPDRYVAAAQA